MPNDKVANPPAGGDQSQASTNDDNVNDVLADKPYVVTISDGQTVGVWGRYSDKAQAESAAAAARAVRPTRIDVKVVKENDIKGGLPDLVAEVAEANADRFDDTPAADAKK